MDAGRVVLDRMAYVRVREVLLMVMRDQGSDQDLSTWLERLAVQDYRALLISTHGSAGHTSKQRGRIAEFWRSAGRKPPPVALLSDSALSRGVLTAIGWLLENPFKAFSPSEVGEALAFLGASAPTHELASEIEALHAALERKARRSA